MDLQPKIAEAIEEHLTVIHQLTAVSPLILQVASELVTTLRGQGKVVLCGNGGSASDAQHIAAEMQGIRAHPGTPQGLLALVLTENTALFTAISNDVGYPAAFRRQVEAIVRKDDLVIGLSTSGRSPNVLEAIRAASQIGARTVALLGKQGELAAIADIAALGTLRLARRPRAAALVFDPSAAARLGRGGATVGAAAGPRDARHRHRAASQR